MVLELRYGTVRSVGSAPAAGSPAEPVAVLPLGFVGAGADAGEVLLAVAAGAALLTLPVEVQSLPASASADLAVFALRAGSEAGCALDSAH